MKVICKSLKKIINLKKKLYIIRFHSQNKLQLNEKKKLGLF